ncbi:MAG: right-handed parallel beta-helix repeat-containing protein [Acidimicrobiia bacterium]
MRRFALLAATGALLMACTAPPTSPIPPKRVSNDVEVRTAGTVIHDVRIEGSVDVYAPNVTIRRVRITCGAYWCIRQHEGASGLLVEDADIGPEQTRSEADGIWAESFTGRRLNIHNVSDGIKAWSHVYVAESHIHALSMGVSDHSDGVQVQGGSDIVLERNDIEAGTNAAVFLSSDQSAVTDVVIRDNRLSNGTFTMLVRTGPYGPPRRVQVERNRFAGRAKYGPFSSDIGVAMVGNVQEATGHPVTGT